MKEEMEVVTLTGEFTQGARLNLSVNDEVRLPREVAGLGDEFYLVSGKGIASLNIRVGDVVIIERRRTGRARISEIVLVILEKRAYLGRFWRKDGHRALVDHVFHPLVQSARFRVQGVLAPIVRC
jgi:hypothetical protein